MQVDDGSLFAAEVSCTSPFSVVVLSLGNSTTLSEGTRFKNDNKGETSVLEEKDCVMLFRLGGYFGSASEDKQLAAP